MVEFLRKFENRTIKSGRDNSILSPKSINLQLFTLILYGVMVRCDVDIFKLTTSALSIYWEVDGISYSRAYCVSYVLFNYFYSVVTTVLFTSINHFNFRFLILSYWSIKFTYRDTV